MRERRILCGGHDLRAITAGQGGTPLLLLASPVIHTDLYRTTVLQLAKRGVVTAVDLPGCGWSSRVVRPLTFAEYASLVPLVVAELGWEACVLVGHSNSGAIALHAAATHAQCVRCVVLTDSIGTQPPRTLPSIATGRAVDAVLEPGLTVRGLPVVALNLLRHCSNFLTQIRQTTADLSPIAAKVQIPAVIAWGRRDHTVPASAVQRLRAAIPHAHFIELAKGSHDWIITHPRQYAEAVRESLNRFSV